MNRRPTVSIGMPLYNAATFVGQAIESLLNQTYQDFELVIADNCSTDGTYKVLWAIHPIAKLGPSKTCPCNKSWEE